MTSSPADFYMLAQALFLRRHFRRAFHLLNPSRLLRDLRFRFLAAKCLEELKGWHQCLMMLGDAKVDEHGNVLDGSDIYFDKDAEDHEINIKSAICFLRGKAYEALDNRDLARQWIHFNPHNKPHGAPFDDEQHVGDLRSILAHK